MGDFSCAILFQFFEGNIILNLKRNEKSNKNRILFFSGSGIGNTILQTPTINMLLEKPDFKVDILFRTKAMSTVYKFDSRVNKTLVLPQGRKNRKTFLKSFRGKYDSIVTLFPSNRPNYNKFPFRIGAPNRIIHGYPTNRFKTRSFLSNIKIDIDESLHDVYQNLNLLQPFNISIPEKPKVTFSTSTINKKYADDFLKSYKIKDKRIIGIHPGCNEGQTYKRWSLDNYLQVAHMFQDMDITPLFFFGPDDRTIQEDFLSRPRDFHYVEEPDLNNVACIIEKCNLFLSSDSGLGHIAVAMGTRSYAITGPAHPTRTSPFGGMGNVINAGLSCSPCLRYPFKSIKSSITCVYSGEEQYKCLIEISPKMVVNTIRDSS